ncbi:MAG: UPF0280 family protein [Candidatus Omnitrophica bacterium]|nr:UPF0280 family protein [Candidatus Omnitrophota bacterium]
MKANGLYECRIVVKETDLHIFTDRPIDKDFVKARIQLYRLDIENYISKDRRFLVALKPIAVELHAKPIIKDMCRAAKIAGVGPMAAVAGAIAQALGRDLSRRGYKEIIIENGGDIFLVSRQVRLVGIYTGRKKLWGGFKLKIKPQDTPLGICTSSGTIGHSLSFGSADSAVILAKNASLADAVATAVANLVKDKRSLAKALEFARSIPGVWGAVIIIKDSLASYGKIEFSR